MTTGVVSAFSSLGSLSSLSFHSNCSPFTFAFVRVDSSLAQPLRCGSPPKVNQLAADNAEQPMTIAASTLLAERAPRRCAGNVLHSKPLTWNLRLYSKRHDNNGSSGHMIAHLRGTVLEKHPNEVIVEASGVGYEVQIPISTYTSLPGAGAPVSLRIYTHVREDTLSLFGFATVEEKQVFERLLSVSGI